MPLISEYHQYSTDTLQCGTDLYDTGGSGLYATGDIDETRRRVDQTVQLSMFISIPCAVGLAVLAQPIVSLLFGGTNGVAGKLLMLGSFTILLNGMSNISNGVLQGIGKPKVPMMTAAVALVVDVIAVVLLLMFTDLGIYALLVAMLSMRLLYV